jgi:peptide/nickel transport system substrate-binding protein
VVLHTRSRVVRAIVVAVVAALAAVAAGSALPTPAGAAAAAPAYDPKGVLRWATDLTGPGMPVYDPAKMTVADSGTVLGQLLYDTLLRVQPDGSYTPELAKSAKIVDAQTIGVVLRPNLKFQDGTPIDATAVSYTITRNRDATSIAFPGLIKDVASVDVVDPTNLTIHLTKPEAGAFYALLAGLATMPISRAAVERDDDNPVTNPLGGGPFRVKEYTPEQHLLLTKSTTYWNAKNTKLAGIEYVQAPIGPAAINDLRAGSVDAIGSDITQLQALSGGSIKTATASNGTSLLWFTVCKTQKPVDDVRVRQAMNYALDRDTINQGLAGGLGEPAWSIVPKGNAVFAPALDKYYAYNPKKAKALLKAAGYANGVDVSVIATPGIPAQLAQIAQQDWAKVGINASIVTTPNIVQDLFTDHKANMGAASVIRGGLDALQFIYTPGHLGDLCDYQDPTLTAKINQIAALPATDPQYKQLWQDAQTFVVKNALAVWGLWVPAVIAYDSARLGGVRVVFPGVTAYPDFFSAYVKK